MKFRIKDLEKYLGKKNNWQKVAKNLSLKSFETVYDKENSILEVDILPNRYPDASSLIGLAREISLIMGWRLKEDLKIEYFSQIKQKANRKLRVVNKIPAEAPYYFGRIILNVNNKPSPSWLKEFVQFYGFNSVNFLVDLANLVMVETGAPLHIFDLDKIKQEVFVRKAKSQEKFIALNGEKYQLNSEDIVIADKEKVIALAGINGSILSEVDQKTKNIFIEAAVFSPINIYRTSRRLNLKTTAAFRFERKVPPIRSKLALERLTSLIKIHLDGDILEGIIGDKKLSSKKIIFNPDLISKLLGLKIDKQLIFKILKSLGIQVKNNVLFIPGERLDLQNPEDIVEEVIRLYGYNKIKPIYEHSYRHSFVDSDLEFNNYLRQLLTKMGYNEVYNYNFFDENWKQLIKEFYPSFIEVYNPIRDDYRYFQNSLMPALIKAVHLNQFNFREIRIFEIEKVAFSYQEKYHLGIALASKNAELILKELKGVLVKLSEETNCKFNFNKLETNFFGKFGVKIEKLGFLGLLEQKLLDKFDLDLNVGLIEIDLCEFKKIANFRKYFKSLPVFATITRDLSFFIDESIIFNDLLEQLQKLKINYLEDIKLNDVYFDKISKQKSMTIRFTFYNSKRNLSNEEVDLEMEKIKKFLAENFNLNFR